MKPSDISSDMESSSDIQGSIGPTLKKKAIHTP